MQILRAEVDRVIFRQPEENYYVALLVNEYIEDFFFQKTIEINFFLYAILKIHC